MSVNYNVNVINDRLQVVVDAIDAGAAAGKLQLGTSSMAVILVTFVFSDPCGTISSGVLTFSNMPITDPYAANTGTASAAQIIDSTGTVIASGLTVGTSGTDVIISQTHISMGDIVALTAATITGN